MRTLLFSLGALAGLAMIAFGCDNCITADGDCFIDDDKGGAKQCECKPEWIDRTTGRCSVCKHKVKGYGPNK